MTIEQLIDSQLELLNVVIKTKDVEWISELKNTLANLVASKEFIARKKKDYR